MWTGSTPRTIPCSCCSAPVRSAARCRIFLRTLRALPADAPWHATVWSPRPLTVPATLSRALRERVEFVEADRVSEAEALAGADVLVLASEGIRPAPGTLVCALAGGVVPVASRLPVYEELLADGEFGFMFEPGDAQTLASHLTRLIAEPDLRRRGPEQARELRAQFSWSRVADELRGSLRRAARPPPRLPRERAGPRPPRLSPSDRRRPAHAHGSLVRLRDAGRGAAGGGPGSRPRGDRCHRPQRDLGRARRRATRPAGSG